MTDPIFLSILSDVLYAIVSAKATGVYEAAVKYALPRLTASIGHANADETWVPSSALELIGTVVRGAPETGLGEGFFSAIAPSVFDCLKVAEDRDILQVRISTYSSSRGRLTWVFRAGFYC
jgi:importin-9